MNKIDTEYLMKRFKKILEEYGEDISADEYDSLSISDKPGRTTIRRYIGSWRDAKRIVMDEQELELVRTANVRLAKERQKYMDSNRLERKSFRQHAQLENAIGEYNKELISLLKENSLSLRASHKSLPRKEKHEKSQAVGVIQFGDAHFNELVNLPFNKYDFKIASQRCEKFIDKVLDYLSLYPINNVVLAITGDLLNSNRRVDELLNQATNRSQATFIAVEIMRNMIIDLDDFYDVSVACVTGNESRVEKEFDWSDIIATDNFDWSIFNILKLLFESYDVNFIGNNYVEQIINVAGKNILLIHGNQLTGKVESSIQRIIGKYALRGVDIDFVLMGHLHSCRIGDTYARNSSIVGGNAYSDSGLQLASRASQNLHIVFDKNNMDSIKIDLQNIDGYKGYDISNHLEAYNARSTDKLHSLTKIIKITT